MTENILKIYFKDLKINIQRKIRKFFEDHEINTYHDEEGVMRSIEEVYNSVIPFYGFVWVDDDDLLLPATDHSEEMVS